jgi:hypothetical protein
MSGLKELTLEKKQERVIQLLNSITSYSGISVLDLVLYLGYEEKQHSSFNKCAQGIRFPKFLKTKIDAVLEKLEQADKNPDLIRAFKESLTADGNKIYKKPPISTLVWIPLDRKLPVADYNGINPPLSIIEMGKKKGIIAFRNTSKYEADGEIYIDTIGMATDIEPGMRIAIKSIDKLDWQTDRYYLIIDISGQISIRELLPGDNKKTVKYVSLSYPDGPHKELLLDRIAAIFAIVDGNCIPRPKRIKPIASELQQ